MKKLKYMAGICLMFILAAACYDDDTTLPDQPVTLAGIGSDAKDTLYLYFGDTIRIKADIEAHGQDVTYQWGIGKYADDGKGNISTVFKTVGTEKDLVYKTNQLGHYHLRQMVTGPDGSSLKYYHVFVDSEFEEGFLILGKKTNGKGSLAFMKTLTPQETEQGMTPRFRQNLFAYANEGKEIYEDALDCDKVGDYLYIMCGQPQKLIMMDAKTFQVTFEYDFKVYNPNFVPCNFLSADHKYCRNFYATSRNGGIARIQSQQLAIVPYHEIPQNLVFSRSFDRESWFSIHKYIFVNDESNLLYMHGNDGVNTFFDWYNCYDYFKDSQIIQFFMDYDENVMVFHKKSGMYKLTKIDQGMSIPWQGGIFIHYEKDFNTNTILTEGSSIVVNDLYTCLFFSHEGEIYKWNYNQDTELPARPFIELPNGEVVKCMSQSGSGTEAGKPNQTELYIATYNPDRAGEFKGSMYIYDADNGTLLNKYEGISDEPVDVFYKIK